jgi:hypothetical protein
MSDAALPRRAAARSADEAPLAKALALAVALAILSVFFLAPLLLVIAKASALQLIWRRCLSRMHWRRSR